MSSSAKESRNGSDHPFAKKEPKPTRARLVSLLDPLGRKRYGEVERFLAGIAGANSGLFYYGAKWGWAVRYLIGAKETLCTLHLLPRNFEATVAFYKDMDGLVKDAELTPDCKRRLSRAKENGGHGVRVPLKSDADHANFQALIGLRVQALQTKKPARPKAKEAPEAPAKAVPAPKPAKPTRAKAAVG